jgi:hypothetical protein
MARPFAARVFPLLSSSKNALPAETLARYVCNPVPPQSEHRGCLESLLAASLRRVFRRRGQHACSKSRTIRVND